MSVSTRWALGVTAALLACGTACTEVVTQEPGTYPSQQRNKPTDPAQTTQSAPATDASQSKPSQPEQQPLIADVSDSELARFFSSMPDGRGLPAGSGTVAQGQTIYAAQCSGCHGAKLEGGVGDRLIGGRGSLAAGARKEGEPPVKTLESYWPYATTLWDYIKRAMPFSNPGSLSNDDVYALTAYILNQAQIVPGDATMNKDTLPKVEMPNRNGFRDAGR
jgi:S-disulfanyl-L-cysteine oxidoreductase SoxD